MQQCTQATNNALAEEKNRMDVLLARQYNLISCMAEHGGGTHCGEEEEEGGCCV
jgi:hypothetical protein